MRPKVYLAHNFRSATYLRTTTAVFYDKYIDFTCSWIHMLLEDPASPEIAQGAALQDLKDIDRADWLIFFAEQFGITPGRGKFFELGYAVATKGVKKIIFIAPNECIKADCVFFNLEYIFVHTLPEAVRFIIEQDHSREA